MMQPRKPVAIGWGSLVWRPEEFPTLGVWKTDGPALPIEFARQSSNGTITLVVVKGARPVPTLWTELGVNTLDEAREALRAREGTSAANVGYWSPSASSTHEEVKFIREWATNKGLDAVVWTALGPKFQGKNNRVPTQDEVTRYLKTGDEPLRSRAREYVERAPEQIRTRYREGFERELGWKGRPDGSMIVTSLQIDAKAWGFNDIRAADSVRGKKLDGAGSPDELVSALILALEEAVREKTIRFAIDSKQESFETFRAIVQFRVDRDLYDWFYNARSGYRAQFWRDPKTGMDFNEKIVDALAKMLAERLINSVNVRAGLIIETNETSREERDVGERSIPRDEFVRSLDPCVAKIWICERIYREGGGVDDIGFPIFSEAREGPKLMVPRWAFATIPNTGETGEGLFAPYPSLEYCWLDLKGGVIEKSGALTQPKQNDVRALQLHSFGWTWPAGRQPP